MSVITVGTTLVTLAPPVEARDGNPRRQVTPRSGPARGPARAEPRPGPRVTAPNPPPRPIVKSPSPLYAPSSVYASPGVGVGVGSRGGVSVGGGIGSSGGGSVMDSVMNGAALGGVGGPIGLAVGAGVGLLHGIWAKNRRDKQSQAEAARQQEIDRQLEREVANQPHGEEQGVRVVKDHLDDEPVRAASKTSDPMVASAPPPPAAPARKAPAKQTPARDAVDDEGFRAVYEGDRLVRRERLGVDGKPEIVLHYDHNRQLVRRQESSRADGRLDTTLFYGKSGLERKESDTDGDGKTDVFATYDGLGNLAQMETVEGARRTRRHFDAAGTVTREDQLGAKGEVVASAFYDKGRLVRRELYEIDESAFNRVPLVSAHTPETK